MRHKIQWVKFRSPYQKSFENEDGEGFETPKKILAVSPYGFIADDSANIENIFNFWEGHCNFSITEPVVLTIEQVEGVESLDVNTRYRFRIGIGRMFDEKKVKKKVEEVLHCTNEEMQVSEKKKDEMKTALDVAKKYPYFCLYVLPNEKIFCRFSKDFKQIEEDFRLYEKTFDEVGGILINHENISETSWK